MRKAVIDLLSDRPAWRIPAWAVDTIRKAFGEQFDVVAVEAVTSSDGDGSGVSSEAIAAGKGAEVYMGWGVPGAIVAGAGDTLGWVHTAAGGAGSSITPELLASGAVLTNSRGIHAEPIAEWVVGAIAFACKGFHRMVTAQREKVWAKGEFTDGTVRVRDLSSLRVGIYGLGGIGRSIAARCCTLGMEARGVTRSGSSPCSEVTWVGGPEDLESMASQSDILVVAAPETPETIGRVSESVLNALPNDAVMINVARGSIVDESALLANLDSGHLSMCVLDVFQTEPLPPDHPFWVHPRVLVSPHISAVSDGFWRREVDLILENVRRYLEGRELMNVVNPNLGY